MSVFRIIDILFFVVLLIVAIRLVPAAWNMLRIYLGIKTRRLEDASSFAPPPPSAVAALASRLLDVGFRRIGERSTVLPGDKRRFEWDMVDDLTTTYVALASAGYKPGGVLMICYTAFPDGAFVQTGYPTGATVQRPDFYAAPGGTTPEEAVAEHRLRIAEFSTRHGQPLGNRSMADLLLRDDTYRRKHGGITLRWRVYKFVGLTALVTLAAAIQLVRIVAP